MPVNPFSISQVLGLGKDGRPTRAMSPLEWLLYNVFNNRVIGMKDLEKAVTEFALVETMLSKATEFEILPQAQKGNRIRAQITMKRSIQVSGAVKWAVYLGQQFVLDKNCEWLDALPLDVTDEFLENTRFELKIAWIMAQTAAIKELKRQHGTESEG